LTNLGSVRTLFPRLDPKERPVAIGLSTYAFFWRGSDRVQRPLTLVDMVEQTAEAGLTLFQICDHPALATLGPEALRNLRSVADDAGVALEIGTRGLDPEHLLHHLRLAESLGARLLRSMVTSGDDCPTRAEAASRLREVLPAFAAQGVTLALETYEQVQTRELLALVEELDDAHLGICLDPGNTVAALERPVDVVNRCAPRTVNLHVKDFGFARSPGWVGFELSGRPLGTGLLDLDHLLGTVRPVERGISQIVEHWLPWQEDAAATCAAEVAWTQRSIDVLRAAAVTR
jgi:sugar phosphate isomerase/epimerase